LWTGDEKNVGRTQEVSLTRVEDQHDVDNFFIRCDTNTMCAGKEKSEQ
jgi:hypothetical protein